MIRENSPIQSPFHLPESKTLLSKLKNKIVLNCEAFHSKIATYAFRFSAEKHLFDKRSISSKYSLNAAQLHQINLLFILITN
jgi:hypothetical protein